MNRFLAIFSIYFSLLSCQSASNKNDILDKSKITILHQDESFNPTDEELILAENLVKQRLSTYNSEQSTNNTDSKYVFGDSLHYESKLIQFNNYYRQCITSKNDKGEKVITFNCLCQAYPNWQQEVIVIKDGGTCFFQISVNLDRKIVFGFMINGAA